MANAAAPKPNTTANLVVLCLALAMVAALGLWVARTWAQVSDEMAKEIELGAEGVSLPLRFLLDEAEAGLHRDDGRPPASHNHVVYAEIDAERLSPEVESAFAAAAAAAEKSGRVGVSLPFLSEGVWKAAMALADAPASGRFALIDLSTVLSAWKTARPADDMSVTIATEDERIWWRSPPLEGVIGKDVSRGPFFASTRHDPDLRGLLKMDAVGTDGVVRHVGWQRLRQYGLVACFSRTHGALLTRWLERFAVSAGFALVCGLSLLGIWAQSTRLSRSRRDAERRFAESERILAEWTGATADVVWELDENLRYARIRQVGDKELDFDLQDLVGLTFWEKAGVADPDGDPAWADFAAVMRSHKPFRDFDHVCFHRNGHHHVRATGAPIFDADGVFKGYRGVSVNIDAEKSAAEELARSRAALEASERMLSAVIDQLPATVSVKDPEGRLLIYNKRFADVFELEPGQGVGKAMGQAMPAAQGRAIEGRDRMVLESKRPLELERAYGGYILHIMKFPLFDDADGCIGLVTVGYDITERRRSELKMAESERRLAHMVELLPAGAVYVENDRITVNSATEAITGRSR